MAEVGRRAEEAASGTYGIWAEAATGNKARTGGPKGPQTPTPSDYLTLFIISNHSDRYLSLIIFRYIKILVRRRIRLRNGKYKRRRPIITG